MKQKQKKLGRKLLCFLLALALVVGLFPGMSLTAYAASEVTGANVKCLQYSYFDARSAVLPEITNITLAEAQAFGAAVSCPTTYWMVVYAKDGNNLKWTSNSYKTGEQTSTSWDDFIYGDAYICSNPDRDVTIYFSKGLATISVTGVTLDKESATLTAGGDPVALTATVAPNDATDKTVKWSVGGTNEDAVKLYSDADCTNVVGTDATSTLTVYAKGESAGSATVTVTSIADSSKTESCAVTVNPITYAVTYKVVNGTWSDGEKEDIKKYVESGNKPKVVPTGMKAADGYTSGAWDKNPSETTITGATTFTYTFTAKQPATVTKAPEAKTLTYTGSAQALVNAGTATGGEMRYAIGKDATTAPSDGWSASIPTSTEAGTYYVWYKVVGDENHTDTKPERIEVTIAEAKKEETDTSIETEVNVSEDAPAVKVDNLNEELAAELLSDEEKEEYNQGTPILVYLDVKTLAKTDVPAIDLEAVEKVTKKDDYTYGECLDFSLWKKLGDAELTQIHDTNGKPIKLTITIPDTMKSAPDGYTRTFRIIRVHNGVATVMAEGTGATLEVNSDKFSSYFLVYKDTKGAATTEAITATSTTEATTAASTSDATTAASTTEAAKTSPKTGDSMPIAVLIVLMLSAAGVLVFMDQKKKRN